MEVKSFSQLLDFLYQEACRINELFVLSPEQQTVVLANEIPHFIPEFYKRTYIRFLLDEQEIVKKLVRRINDPHEDQSFFILTRAS